MGMINVAIVEDNDAMREALETILNGSAGFRCVNCHATVEDAIRQIPRGKAQVAIVDLHIGNQLSGIDCIRRLAERRPDLAVLAYTFDTDADTIFQALQAGASGYVLKRNEPGEIFAAIEDVMNGGAPMSRAIARKVLQFFRALPPKKAGRGGPNDEAFALLTEREKEILRRVTVGYSDKQIADQLDISQGTVRKHLQSIYQKLHVNSRGQAIAKVLG